MSVSHFTSFFSLSSIKPNYYEAVQIFAEVLHDLGHTQQALEIFHNASLQCADANFFNSYGYFLGNIGTLDRIVFGIVL